MLELQPRQTFFAPAVAPGQIAEGMRLNGGIHEPFYYSLSSRSTVPYVKITGGTYSNKILSWGEVLMVPPGDMLVVENASYHRGDVAINSGRDYTEIPTRVTVPVNIKLDGTDPRSSYVMDFPVDCRRAKRAYGVINITVSVPFDILIEAAQRESSFVTGVIGDGTPTPINKYFESLTVPAFTKFGLFPLGLRAADTLTPMCLLDTATFSYSIPPGSIVVNPLDNVNLAFYVLEY